MTPFNLWPRDSIKKLADILKEVIEQEEPK